jgi:hypothetical protein
MPLVARHRRGCGSISDRIQIVEEARLTHLLALLTAARSPPPRRARGHADEIRIHAALKVC